MAGCGIRALRYGLEAGAEAVWANDADPDREPLLVRNLQALAPAAAMRVTSWTAQRLLADCLVRRERFDLVDLDAFGNPSALFPLALEAVACGGILYLASTDGRSPTGHDRRAALRRLGAAARVHPASWEMALRLLLGSLARCAWAMGRGVQPVFSFSDGRTFRWAVRLQRSPEPRQEEALGLLAHCQVCGDQQVQSLLRLRPWQACGCAAPAVVISGPLWIGSLQDPASLAAMAGQAEQQPGSATPQTLRLLHRLRQDAGLPARCWPTATIARHLGSGPPPLQALVSSLRERGHAAAASGIMEGVVRSDAPWLLILELSASLAEGKAAK